MGRCFLCEPPSDLPDDDLLAHMRVEHDIDVDGVMHKWPDGEWVVHDRTLEPSDFTSASRREQDS